MADRKRTITLSVQDDFSRNLKEFARQMSEAERGVKTFDKASQGTGGTGGFRQAAQDLFFMANAAQQVYQSVSGIFRTADAWGQLGLSAERSRLALEAYSGSAQEADRWIKAIQDSTRGTVTEGEAAAQAYRLMKFGLADTAEEAQRFSRTIAIVAAANPQLGGTAEAINQIQLTMSNMSFMRLDQLGISAGEVRKRIAELKAETAGLSNEEAFQQAVMEELNSQAETLGDSILELSDAQDRMKTRWRGFKEWAGLEIAEGFEGAAVAAESLYTILDLLTDHPWEITVKLLDLLAGKSKEPLPYSDTNPNYFTEAQVMGTTWDQKPGSTVTSWTGQYEDLIRIYAPLIQHGASQEFIQWFKDNGINAISPDVYWAGYYQSLQDASMGAAGQSPTPIPGSRAQYAVTGAQAPGMDTGAYYARQQQAMAANQAYMFNQDILGRVQQDQMQGAFLDRMGLNGQTGGYQAVLDALAGQAMQGAVTLAGQFAGFISDAAGSAVEFVTSTTEAVKQFNSLAEKFGAGASPFDSDVMRAASEALQGVEVEGEQYEEVMRRMALATGEINTQTEIFDGRMATLAQKYADGRLSADQYADAVLALSRANTDMLASVDPLAQIDIGLYDTVIQRLQEMGVAAANAVAAFMNPQSAMDAMGDVMGYTDAQKGASVGGPLGPLVRDMDALDQKFAAIPQMWGEPITTWQNLAIPAIVQFKDSAVTELDAVKSKLNDVFSNVTMTFSVTPYGGGGGAQSGGAGGAGGGSYAATQFAEGGWTGPGASNEIAGSVHKNEYVVPEKGALVVRGGGGGGLSIQTVNLYGVQNPQQLLDQLQQVARGRNMTVMQPLGAPA